MDPKMLPDEEVRRLISEVVAEMSTATSTQQVITAVMQRARGRANPAAVRESIETGAPYHRP